MLRPELRKLGRFGIAELRDEPLDCEAQREGLRGTREALPVANSSLTALAPAREACARPLPAAVLQRKAGRRQMLVARRVGSLKPLLVFAGVGRLLGEQQQRSILC